MLTKRECFGSGKWTNFSFGCGIICVPKSNNCNNVTISKLKNFYENIKSFRNDAIGFWNLRKLNNIVAEFGSYQLFYCKLDPASGAYVHIGKHDSPSEFYRNQESFDFNENDWIDVCIDCNINNEYYLYFINGKNDEIIGNTCTINDKFFNGKIKLDFENYDYLYALTSKRCDCDIKQNVKGFEFQISFSVE